MFGEIDAVTGAEIDSEFANAVADRFDVAEIAEAEATNPGVDPRGRAKVTKTANPSAERCGLANFNHLYSIIYRSIVVKVRPTGIG